MKEQPHITISITVPMEDGDEVNMSYRLASPEAADAPGMLRAYMYLLERLEGPQRAKEALCGIAREQS